MGQGLGGRSRHSTALEIIEIIGIIDT